MSFNLKYVGTEMPLISVIMPTFNNDEYIIEALQSVFTQTYNNYEIIVVDDGSTDTTRDKLSMYSDKIQYHYQDNQGLAVARNTGLFHTRGKYFTFLDGDDVWLPDNLMIKVLIMESDKKLGAVFSDFVLFDNQKTISRRGLTDLYPIFKQRGMSLNSIFENRINLSYEKYENISVFMGNAFNSLLFGNFINACSIVVRKEYQEQIGLFKSELRTQQDYDYWLRFARYYDLGYVDAPLVGYRRHNNQLTAHKNIDRILLNVANILEPYYKSDQIPKSIINKFQKRYSDIFKLLGIAYLGKRLNRQARNAFKKSISINRGNILSVLLLAFSYMPSLITLDMINNIKKILMHR